MKYIVFWDWLGTISIKKQDGLELIKYAAILNKSLKSIDCHQIIASNGKKSEIMQYLTSFGLSFEEVLTVDDFSPKPARDMFKYALNKYSLFDSDCCLIGDTDIDKLSAVRMNFKFFLVDRSKGSYKAVADYFHCPFETQSRISR